MTVPMHPRRAREQQRELLDVQALAERVDGVRLDLDHAAVLELRAEREEHRADEGERDSDERGGVECDLLGEVAQVRIHATTLPVRRRISLANGRAPHTNHRRSGAALPRPPGRDHRRRHPRTSSRDMFETMDAAPGVGLAAPQVGVPLRLFTYGWVDDDGHALARASRSTPSSGSPRRPPASPTSTTSPRAASRSRASDSACAAPSARSCARPTSTAQPFEIEAEGWLARIFQHEYDHLDGTLYADRLGERDQRIVAKITPQARLGQARACSGCRASTTSRTDRLRRAAAAWTRTACGSSGEGADARGDGAATITTTMNGTRSA